MMGAAPHPQNIHRWWARRPLAAARAALWASLVDDPSSNLEQFPTLDLQAIERARLFGILEKLVLWQSSNDEAVLDQARIEIRKSCGNDLPKIVDPFAGGGAIPMEATRLGLETYAGDLNPVPVLIQRAMFEIPLRFIVLRV
jgi:putative DNA methylase